MATEVDTEIRCNRNWATGTCEGKLTTVCKNEDHNYVFYTICGTCYSTYDGETFKEKLIEHREEKINKLMNG